MNSATIIQHQDGCEAYAYSETNCVFLGAVSGAPCKCEIFIRQACITPTTDSSSEHSQMLKTSPSWFQPLLSPLTRAILVPSRVRLKFFFGEFYQQTSLFNIQYQSWCFDRSLNLFRPYGLLLATVLSDLHYTGRMSLSLPIKEMRKYSLQCHSRIRMQTGSCVPRMPADAKAER